MQEPLLWRDEGIIHVGAEAEVRVGSWLGLDAVRKIRRPRGWRHPDLDRMLTLQRMEAEYRSLVRLSNTGIRIPSILHLDRNEMILTMTRVEGTPLIEHLRNGAASSEDLLRVGAVIRRLHRAGIVHGDLSTNNILWSEEAEPALIDLGLSSSTTEVERFGIDLHVLEEILGASHPEHEDGMVKVEEGYLAVDESEGPPVDHGAGALPSAAEVVRRLEEIRTRVRYHG